MSWANAVAGPADRLIPLDQQAEDGRARRGQPCPSQLAGLTQQDGDGIDQTQHGGGRQ
jgi:hypothetical protein